MPQMTNNEHARVNQTFYDQPDRFTLLMTVPFTVGDGGYQVYYDEVDLVYILTMSYGGRSRPMIQIVARLLYDIEVLLRAYTHDQKVVRTSAYHQLQDSLVKLNKELEELA